MASSEKRKLFKLGLPLTFKRNDSEIVVSDGFFSHSIAFTELDEVEFKSIDIDGFIAFEIHYAKPEKIVTSPQVQAMINGYVLFHTSVPKSLGYGEEKSIYEYYKRERDLSYYSLIKRDSKTKKIWLGSLKDPRSRIYQVIQMINQTFSQRDSFDRKKLRSTLPPNLTHGQKLKSLLDILTAEGFLGKTETKRRGKLHEEFMKTKKLEEFMFDPRSFPKPSGVQLGQVVLTSDR